MQKWVMHEHKVHMIVDWRPSIPNSVTYVQFLTICGIRDYRLLLHYDDPPQRCEKCMGIFVRRQLLTRRK